jgi:hypothetical protein
MKLPGVSHQEMVNLISVCYCLPVLNLLWKFVCARLGIGWGILLIVTSKSQSHPVRDAWIEIERRTGEVRQFTVASRAGCVD